jgi:hypothetical protein
MNSVMTNTASVATTFQSNVDRSKLSHSKAWMTMTRKASGCPAPWLMLSVQCLLNESAGGRTARAGRIARRRAKTDTLLTSYV